MLSAVAGFVVPSAGSCGPSADVAKTRRILGTLSSPTTLAQQHHHPLVMAAAPVVKRVAIVGAGIGGLTLANALSTGNTAIDEVKVFEKFDSVKPGIGGGVQINSGAVILARLGLGDAVKVMMHGVETTHRPGESELLVAHGVRSCCAKLSWT